VSRAAAAHAVHEIVTAAMASAVHVVTVQRGIDPRGHVLVAFGGAGPMHAARVAERFGIGTVVVPPFCGVASAAGLLSGDLSADRVLSRLDESDPGRVFADLTASAAADLGVTLTDPEVTVLRSADVRFAGQAHDLTVPWSDSPETLAEAFYERYRQVYGISQRGPVEVVGYRVRVTRPVQQGPPATPTSGTSDTSGTSGTPGSVGAGGNGRALRNAGNGPRAGARTRRAFFAEAGGYVEVPVRTRADVGATAVRGPMIVEDAESTIVVPPGWTVSATPQGAVVIERAATQEAMVKETARQERAVGR
jgi:N-methylhydantoinase A